MFPAVSKLGQAELTFPDQDRGEFLTPAAYLLQALADSMGVRREWREVKAHLGRFSGRDPDLHYS
jgi:hypothetical protein